MYGEHICRAGSSQGGIPRNKKKGGVGAHGQQQPQNLNPNGAPAGGVVAGARLGGVVVGARLGGVVDGAKLGGVFAGLDLEQWAYFLYLRARNCFLCAFYVFQYF